MRALLVLALLCVAACQGRTFVDPHPRVPHPGEGEGSAGGEGEGARGGEGEGEGSHHSGEGEGEGSGDQGCTMTIEIIQPICAAH